MVDPVSREEIIDEYMDSDILFIHLNDLPVFEKVVPSKIFELAAIEKPILAGVNGYPREFLSTKILPRMFRIHNFQAASAISLPLNQDYNST